MVMGFLDREGLQTGYKTMIQMIVMKRMMMRHSLDVQVEIS